MKDLKEYLLSRPGAQRLSKEDLTEYRQEMVNKVIPQNLSAAVEKKQLAADTRMRAAARNLAKKHPEE